MLSKFFPTVFRSSKFKTYLRERLFSSGSSSKHAQPRYRLPFVRSVVKQIPNPPTYTFKIRHPKRYYCSKSAESNAPGPIESTLLPENETIPLAPKLISYATLLPLITGSVFPFVFPPEIAGQALFYQLTFATTALSFHGAVHWGLALAEFKRNDDPQSTAAVVPSSSDQTLRYFLGPTPAIAAWICSTQDPLTGTIGLISCFVVLFVIETFLHTGRLTPAWYIKLRARWTFAAVASLGINLIHLF